jgi:hypothetical protein
VYVVGTDGDILVPKHSDGKKGSYTVWVLANQELKMEASLTGFGGSESQYRTQLGRTEQVRILADNGKYVNLPMPMPSQVFSYTWKTPGQYTVEVHATGYYHWSGDDGSCSYSCVTRTECPGNGYIRVWVIDKPSFPGKKYPSTYPDQYDYPDN